MQYLPCSSRAFPFAYLKTNRKRIPALTFPLNSPCLIVMAFIWHWPTPPIRFRVHSANLASSSVISVPASRCLLAANSFHLLDATPGTYLFFLTNKTLALLRHEHILPCDLHVLPNNCTTIQIFLSFRLAITHNAIGIDDEDDGALLPFLCPYYITNSTSI